MIRTESLTKYFGQRCAIRDFDVEIESREIVGFLGLNGAGKTTALRMLAGILAPSSGRVVVDGEDLEGPNGHHARARIGFLPDRPPLYEEMSVRAYLIFAAKLRGHEGDDRRVAEVLERTALVEYADAPITTLSHGYRQRVGIAQAIVHDPALVILDEPTSGLDPRQIVDMRALIRSLRDAHTVLLSSHNLNEVSETCDQVLVIDDGRLEAQGAPQELAARLGGVGRKMSFDLVGSPESIDGALHAALESGLISSHEREGPRDADAHIVVLEMLGEPEAIARHFFEAGLGLRRMQPSRTELEGLFAELTRRAS